MGAVLDGKCSGGSIAHINLESNFQNTDMAWDMLNKIAQAGVIYFAFNTRINECENHHALPELKYALSAESLSMFNEVKDVLKEEREAILLPDFSCHILRHTFCTRLCENEPNLKIIQEIMGHSKIETTMDVYNEAT